MVPFTPQVTVSPALIPNKLLMSVLQSWLFCNRRFGSRRERGIKVANMVEPIRVMGNGDLGDGAEATRHTLGVALGTLSFSQDPDPLLAMWTGGQPTK